MIELIQITNDPSFAQRCEALGGFRLFVDLERHGKHERQAGRNTFISTHEMAHVGRVKRAVRKTPLMVRLNPLHNGSGTEVEAALGEGADLLMLPMFSQPAELRAFCALVAGRVPVVPLLETAGALATLDDWVDTPGLGEVFVGLNDLHLSLGLPFMFLPLARGQVDRVAQAARRAGLRFGFGGIARAHEGLLPGRDVLAEHLRLGSHSVILSRTFRNAGVDADFEAHIAELRSAEAELAKRTPHQVQLDRERIAQRIEAIAGELAPSA